MGVKHLFMLYEKRETYLSVCACGEKSANVSVQ